MADDLLKEGLIVSLQCILVSIVQCAPSPGSMNGFASGNLVRACNSPLWQPKKSFFLLELEFVIICASSNMLVGCPFMSFLGTL